MVFGPAIENLLLEFRHWIAGDQEVLMAGFSLMLHGPSSRAYYYAAAYRFRVVESAGTYFDRLGGHSVLFQPCYSDFSEPSLLLHS
jgi:hypothetical protein